jgi:VWFA-related protein
MRTGFTAFSATLFALLLLLSFPLPAQDGSTGGDTAGGTGSQDANAPTPWQAIFGETVEVNVINIEVVVTDQDGNPVSGLKPEDFVVQEEGDPIEITNFYEISAGEVVPLVSEGYAEGEETGAGEEGQNVVLGGAEEAQTPPLSMILFVDNANISPTNRERLFNNLREFLQESWRDGMRVMLAGNDRSLVIRQGFTTNRDEVLAALEDTSATANSVSVFEQERRQLIRDIADINVEEGSGLFNTTRGVADAVGQDGATRLIEQQISNILNQIRGYTERRLQWYRGSLQVLSQMIDTAAGLPGRKMVVYISDGLSLRPGEALFDAAARRFEAMAEAPNLMAQDRNDDRFSLMNELQALLAQANTSKVTFYTINAAPPAATTRGSAATTAGAGGNFGTWDSSLGTLEQQNLQDTMIVMAQSTGGRYGLTPRAVAATLQGIVTDFDNHYSLGYVADRLPDGKRREIKVRLAEKQRGYDVRYRSIFRDKSATEETSERTLSALVLEGLDNPLEIALETQEHQPQDEGLFMVPLRVSIPLNKLVLVPGAREHQAKVSLYVAVRDDRGRTSTVQHHLCPIRIPNDELLTALGRSGTCGVRLLMRGGEQRIAVSVRDDLAAVASTARLDLQVGTRTADTGR